MGKKTNWDSWSKKFLLHGKWKGDKKLLVVDIETAFLYGDLEEEIYMESPQGTNITKYDCTILIKCIYGFVQAAR